MTAVDYAAPSIANIFPAKVLNPDGGLVVDQARVIVTPTLVVVYAERKSPSGLRQIYTHSKLTITAARPHPATANGWIVTDETGAEWSIVRGSGCGCGSPLKTMPSPPPVDIG